MVALKTYRRRSSQGRSRVIAAAREMEIIARTVDERAARAGGSFAMNSQKAKRPK